MKYSILHISDLHRIKPVFTRSRCLSSTAQPESPKGIINGFNKGLLLV